LEVATAKSKAREASGLIREAESRAAKSLRAAKKSSEEASEKHRMLGEIWDIIEILTLTLTLTLTLI